MTGTADTEAEEFMSIYKLEVVVVPTNRPMIREDCPDVIYRTEKEKFDAVIDEIRELNKISRPVLVGTISIEKSELLSKKLKKFGSNYETRIVPGGKIRQVHAYDPDGNHVEIAFSTREKPNPKLLCGE